MQLYNFKHTVDVQSLGAFPYLGTGCLLTSCGYGRLSLLIVTNAIPMALPPTGVTNAIPIVLSPTDVWRMLQRMVEMRVHQCLCYFIILLMHVYVAAYLDLAFHIILIK